MARLVLHCQTEMGRHILWSPERGVCSCCERSMKDVRKFTSPASEAVYCSTCWRLFLDECDVDHTPWTQDVAKNWRSDVILELYFTGEVSDGAAQAVAGWN